jgi:hypothetical protein
MVSLKIVLEEPKRSSGKMKEIDQPIRWTARAFS